MYPIRNFLRLFSLIIFIALSCQQTSARGPVWKVSNGVSNLYLGGTIHVLSKSDYPLPSGFDVAYSKADTLVFETDVAALSTAKTQQKFAQLMTLENGQELNQVLHADTVSELTKFLSARKISKEALQSLSPVGLSLSLTLLELQRLGIEADSGVETHFNLRSSLDGKAQESLETIDQQLHFIRMMDALDPNVLVLSTIKDLAALESQWDLLTQAWRIGDVDELEKMILLPMQQEFPELAKALLETRNKHWMESIPSMLDDPDVELILVGSLHLVGEKGLLTLLKKQGYLITQLD
jgi:uncharacterized protein YbaP (TraB family)